MTSINTTIEAMTRRGTLSGVFGAYLVCGVAGCRSLDFYRARLLFLSAVVRRELR